MERREYDKAMALLSTIPNTVDEYPVIADMLVEIYVKRLDVEATDIVNRAQVMENRGEFDDAVEALLKVHQSSTLYPTALKRIESIQKRISEEEKQKVEALLAQQQAEHDAEIAKLKAKYESESAQVEEKLKLQSAMDMVDGDTDTEDNNEADSTTMGIVNQWLSGTLN